MFFLQDNSNNFLNLPKNIFQQDILNKSQPHLKKNNILQSILYKNLTLISNRFLLYILYNCWNLYLNKIQLNKQNMKLNPIQKMYQHYNNNIYYLKDIDQLGNLFLYKMKLLLKMYIHLHNLYMNLNLIQKNILLCILYIENFLYLNMFQLNRKYRKQLQIQKMFQHYNNNIYYLKAIDLPDKLFLYKKMNLLKMYIHLHNQYMNLSLILKKSLLTFYTTAGTFIRIGSS